MIMAGGGAALAVLALLLSLWVSRKVRSGRAADAQLIEELKRQNTILRSEVAEMRSGLVSLNKRIKVAESNAEQLARQQSEMQYEDPDARLYSRAVKMVELGADIEEIIRECELPRAEAELLLTLHKQKSR